MPHFFINSCSINDNKITISDKENYNHVARSLHAKVGETLLLVDENQIQYETTIDKITSSTIISIINKSYQSKRFLPINLYLAQSVLKKEAQTDAIQKACELGVKGIYPIITDNSTIKKSYVAEKIEKYNKIKYFIFCPSFSIYTLFYYVYISMVLIINKYKRGISKMFYWWSVCSKEFADHR